MGVRGLSTFVDNNQQLLSDHKLHDTQVIIDGNNLYYFLFYHYKVSHQFGGDYDHYARKCKLFFNVLKSCNVTPYVVFDGGYDPDDRKLPTILKRVSDRRNNVSLLCATGRGNVLPILTFETFRQVLVELGVPHVSCQFEADREIAVLAKEWKCPVLSNDSDFFIYNLEAGYVQFDYMNLTLCVCDALSGEEKVLDFKKSLTENQFVYIPVKLYLSERFVKKYHKNVENSVLPLFATLLGNDYVDSTKLSQFYERIHVPKSPSKKILVPKTHTKMVAVLHWLDSLHDLDEGLEKIVQCVPKEKRTEIHEVLTKSLEEYKNLNSYTSIILSDFFEENTSGNSETTAQSANGSHLELTDFYGDAVPSWFVEGLRKCEIAAFLQNVTVLHRVIFLCQVELLKELSTYSCSKGIRQIIYGIIFENKKAENSDEESRDALVVEYDRDVKNTKKFYAHPIHELSGFTQLPSLQTLCTESKNARMRILLMTLGLPEELLLNVTDAEESSVLLVGILCHWIRNAEPKVTGNHLTCVLVCTILLHVRTLKWLVQKTALGGNPVRPLLCENIARAYQSSTAKQLVQFEKFSGKHFQKPEHSAKHPRENAIVHGFSQFQACLFDTVNLNQLLLNPVQPPSPSLILNGMFVYNMCRDLQTRVNPDLYIREMLGNGSPLYNIFDTLNSMVLNVCSGDFFEETKSSASRKKSKSKAKKVQRQKSKEEKESNSSSDMETVDKKQKKSISVNCDVNNRFSILDLDD